MKRYQAVIFAVGLIGVVSFFVLSVSTRFQLFGVLTQQEEILAEAEVIRCMFELSVLMAGLALLWQFVLPREGGKWRLFIIAVYWVPLLTEVSFLVFALFVALSSMH